jgi:glyoxylase I family protein
MTPVFQHVALTVSDHDRSKRFYTEALGFKALHTKSGNDAAFPGLSKLLGADGIDNFAQDLVNGGQTIELVSFRNPKATGPLRTGQNQLGLSHLCFYVEDLSKATEKIEEFGGKILAESKVAHSKPDGVDREYIMCTDPDGLRLLLYAGRPRTDV